MSTHENEPQIVLDPAPRLPGRWPMVVAIVAAIVAATVAWLIGESRSVWAIPKQVPMVTMGTRHMGTTEETMRDAVVATSARLQGIFGASIGLAMALAGGLVSRRPFRPLPPLIGLILGGALGFAASYIAVPLYFRWLNPAIEELIPATLLHGSIALVIGFAAALAFGLGVGGTGSVSARAIVGGLFGALIGTAIYEIVGATFFSTDDPGEPISKTAATRLLARLLIAAFIALGASTGLGRHQSSSALPGASPGRSG